MHQSTIRIALFSVLVTSIPLSRDVVSLDSSIKIRNTLNARQGGTVRNDLVDGECAAVTVVFARGTTEPGNVGTVVGPPLFSALDQTLGAGNVAAQGVDYPADVAGFLAGGDDAGAATMADLVTQAATDCPDTQIVMSGYSQGAQVVSKAAVQLSADVAGRVAAVVLFGNPNGNDPVPNVDNAGLEIFCNAGDLICAGQAVVLPAHLAYGADAGEAADFIASRVTV